MKKFTLIELIIVIVIIAILLAMLFPALNASREMTKRLYCMNNVKQMIAGTQLYLSNNEKIFPEANGSQFKWWGKSGNYGGYGSGDLTVQKRYFNKYFSPVYTYNANGDSLVEGYIPATECPKDLSNTKYTAWVPSPLTDATGSSYIPNAAADNSGEPFSNMLQRKSITQCLKPSITIVGCEYGAAGYTWPNGQEQNDNIKFWHFPGKPMWNSFFVDGHGDYMEFKMDNYTREQTGTYTFHFKGI